MIDTNKRGLLNKILNRRSITIILILGIGFIISVGIFAVLFGEGDTHIHCYIEKDINMINGPIIQITEKDFIEHPALEEMVIWRKNVLISHGPIIDTYYWLIGSRGDRISPEESEILISNYPVFEYNKNVYSIAQTQCEC